MLYVGLMTRADREDSVRSRCICALAMQACRRSTWLCRSTVCRVRAYGHTSEVRWVSLEADLDTPILWEIMVNWAVIRSRWVDAYKDADGCPCNTRLYIAPGELSSPWSFNWPSSLFRSTSRQELSVRQGGPVRYDRAMGEPLAAEQQPRTAEHGCFRFSHYMMPDSIMQAHKPSRVCASYERRATGSTATQYG